ncbi:type II toxin-antitoxin system Y4mF family antitoxin [Pseudarthrobacter sp. fls2-241-R2A-168]|uniref:type II toxin-antitoxin system Y4mF family antitoxin n=1 Tax=Pseudarthrobacter sp. fls2-241-R2A-168 TaxID=3040304 RepID=UPI003305E55A
MGRQGSTGLSPVSYLRVCPLAPEKSLVVRTSRYSAAEGRNGADMACNSMHTCPARSCRYGPCCSRLRGGRVWEKFQPERSCLERFAIKPSFSDHLAAEVRARRAVLRLTQHDLAQLAGVSERFVRFVEQGKPSVQLDSLLALLDTLGLELQLVTRTHAAARGGAAAGPRADRP